MLGACDIRILFAILVARCFMKPSSIAKIAANRKNAVNSTGPKTTSGKMVSSKNASRHGILSKDVIIRFGPLQEDEADYDKMHCMLVEDLQPQGILEELLVKEIADCHWRLRRIQRCEVGKIAHQFNNYYLGMPKILSLRWLKPETDQYYQAKIDSLKRIETELRDGQSLSTESKKFLESLSDSPASACNKFDRLLEQNRAAGLGENAKEFRRKRAEVLQQVRYQIEISEMAQENDNVIKTEELTLDIASKNLPPTDVSNGILRYETAIKRDLYRAIDQLERIQRRRKGDFVPAPAELM
jgi:hypothetical protein